VAPLDRRAQRALARRGVARGARKERQAPVEPGKQLFRIEQREARRRELDRERKPVEPAADLADCLRRAERGSDRAPALDEEDLGVGVAKRLNRVAPLRLDMERLAARDEHFRVRRAADQRRYRRCRLDDLLEVVEEHEQPLVCDVFDQAVVGADRRPDRPLDQCGVADGLERNPEDAVGKLLDRVGSELQREPRLSAPAGPGQRHQAVGANELACLRELAPPADQRRRLYRQVCPIQRAQRRKASVAELEEPVRGAEVLQAMLAEVNELAVFPEKLPRRLREQDLPAVARAHDPRRAVDVYADVPLVGHDRFAGVDTDPHPHRTADQRGLNVARGGDRASRVRERHEEGVALGADLEPAMP
jgi:hypothetical protein